MPNLTVFDHDRNVSGVRQAKISKMCFQLLDLPSPHPSQDQLPPMYHVVFGDERA